MNRRKMMPVLLVAFVFISCNRKPMWKQEKFTNIELTHLSDSIPLPHDLWEKIEGLLTADRDTEPGAKEKKPSEEVRPPSEISLPTIFAPLKVFLIEKNKGILTHGNTELTFGPGGGEIDLHDFVEEKNGSFSLVAEFVPEFEDATTHVYFLSNSVIRRLGNEKLGSGCDTYFDVSKAFAKAAKIDGFLVNTTEGRHVSALAGTYFFAAVHNASLYLASLVIGDSLRPKLQCR